MTTSINFKMPLNRLISILLIIVVVQVYTVATDKITFGKCGANGFICTNATDNSKNKDIVFQCNTNVTGQNVTIYLWGFNSPDNINSLTIQNCEVVRISFECTYSGSGMKWLKIANVKHLEIIPAMVTRNAPLVIMENITYLETIPRHTFSQIKYPVGSCQTHANDLRGIIFNNVSIGTIETEAFWNLTEMKNFSWVGVSVYRTNMNAIEVNFVDEISGKLLACDFNIVEPLAFRISGDGFFVTHSKFGNIWGSGFNGTVSTFVFNNNSVAYIQAGAISILAKNVYMIDNRFNAVESGAFQKIGPGLLRDSKMNFADLRFVYMFTKNYMEAVVNGGVEPDMVAYKNVASDVTYAYNIMQVFMRTPSHENHKRTNIIWQ